MRLGIDLGTTRTIVAAHDRGNFPVVGFTAIPQTGSFMNTTPFLARTAVDSS